MQRPLAPAALQRLLAPVGFVSMEGLRRLKCGHLIGDGLCASDVAPTGDGAGGWSSHDRMRPVAASLRDI